jgi:hypothetical protein
VAAFALTLSWRRVTSPRRPPPNVAASLEPGHPPADVMVSSAVLAGEHFNRLEEGKRHRFRTRAGTTVDPRRPGRRAAVHASRRTRASRTPVSAGGAFRSH